MATLTISDETYARLERRAAALKTTVEAVAIPALEQATQVNPPVSTNLAPADLPYVEWKKLFDEHMAERYARGPLYPPGHFVDDSRESIYAGCGE